MRDIVDVLHDLFTIGVTGAAVLVILGGGTYSLMYIFKKLQSNFKCHHCGAEYWLAGRANYCPWCGGNQKVSKDEAIGLERY